jgi:hypothetical protein
MHYKGDEGFRDGRFQIWGSAEKVYWDAGGKLIVSITEEIGVEEK